jgi:8-oxo-dGTP diphosphatase
VSASSEQPLPGAPSAQPDDEPNHAGAPARVALGAASVVVDPRGRVLLVRHTYRGRNWEIPGGLAEPGEDPESTARRELREETGLDLDAGRLTGMYFEPGHDFGPFLHIVFRIDLQGPVAPIPSSDEIDAAAFFATDAFPRPMSDFTQRRIRDALASTAVAGVVGRRTWLD